MLQRRTAAVTARAATARRRSKKQRSAKPLTSGVIAPADESARKNRNNTANQTAPRERASINGTVAVGSSGCCCFFGAADARDNGTTDQGTRATKNDARAEPPRTWNERTPVTRDRGRAMPLSPGELGSDGPLSPANVQIPDPCHPRTWNLKNVAFVVFLSFFLSGLRWHFSGSTVLFGKRTCVSGWLGGRDSSPQKKNIRSSDCSGIETAEGPIGVILHQTRSFRDARCGS